MRPFDNAGSAARDYPMMAVVVWEKVDIARGSIWNIIACSSGVTTQRDELAGLTSIGITRGQWPHSS
jgi:hypothetical protein